MKFAPLAARLLLGAVFTISGAFGFVMLFTPAPAPPPGLAATFFTAYAQSHWLQFVDAAQLLAGVLLLAGRYLRLALVMLGGILYNILVFHITLAPAGLLPGVVCTALWAYLLFRDRAFVRELFAR